LLGNNTDRPATIRERNKKGETKKQKPGNFKMGKKKFALDSLLRIRIRKALSDAVAALTKTTWPVSPPPIVAYVTMLARPTQQEIRRKNEKIRPRRCCVVTSSSSKIR
jgi:hypothetical protein